MQGLEAHLRLALHARQLVADLVRLPSCLFRPLRGILCLLTCPSQNLTEIRAAWQLWENKHTVPVR